MLPAGRVPHVERSSSHSLAEEVRQVPSDMEHLSLAHPTVHSMREARHQSFNINLRNFHIIAALGVHSLQQNEQKCHCDPLLPM